MKQQEFLKLVISARNILPQDLVDKLLILGEKFTDTERDDIAVIIRKGMKKTTTQINAGIRSMKKIIREMKAVQEEQERKAEPILLPQ